MQDLKQRLTIGVFLLSMALPGVTEPLDMDELLPKEEANPAAAAPDSDNAAPAVDNSVSATPAPPQASTSPASPEIKNPERGVLVVPLQPKTISITMPGRGMKMQDVEAKFGAPLSKDEAVGKPPISSWRYEQFTVYFEREFVLHSVANDP